MQREAVRVELETKKVKIKIGGGVRGELWRT
jgi:hypothetical protein